MKNFIFVAAFSSLVSLTWAEDVAPLDPKTILLELQSIQTKQKSEAADRHKQKLDLIFRAASNKEAAIAFYEDAQMATQFEGTNRENSQFRDWKKRQEEQLKDPDFREAVRLHLFYLALSLKRAASAKPEELVSQVEDYLKTLEAAPGPLEVKDSLLKVSVSDGIFAKWLGLGPSLGKSEDWEMVPGKADQIAAKFLLPQWRKVKSLALLAYWDAKIVSGGAAAGSEKLDFQEKNFATIRKPDLLWRRAQELIVLDQPNRAAQEMYSIIKTYPTHPNIPTWIGELEKLLVAPGPVSGG